MKILFRRKSDGKILRPIQTLVAHVRLHHAASDRVSRASKAKLPEKFDVITHGIERGDVLRDIRDGSMWIVEYVGLHGVRMQNQKDGVAGMTYFGLVNHERVGRKYRIRDRQPHARAKTRYATYDAKAKMDRARHAMMNRFDAVLNAQRQAQEYGVGFIRVEPDGSMKAIDPRSVILK
ncbi:hypothetical protein P9616_gp52 [Escherichia phage CEC_Kaz_2018]|uniref:Uncharacterized protein n=1 Tax=Escherichia phage CEC_Kaz_2018 TaxID=2565596 RepID=A0A4P8EYI0_9CAUD|nr:hypothetical protein P9616_gp52 [Escherichia phage CEC_Kaz_2018]QCO71648.1 hypothetical protein [Escherichia phage CEC_Kaz_2018]